MYILEVFLKRGNKVQLIGTMPFVSLSSLQDTARTLRELGLCVIAFEITQQQLDLSV